MKTFFSYFSVVLAALVIWAGCDSLVTPNSDEGLSSDVGLIAYSYVEPGVLAELEEAIRTLAVQWEEAIESNQACLYVPFDREDVDPLHDRLDQLLGQLGDGINRHNFWDHIADLNSTDWARLDSLAMNALLQDYRALRAPYDATCPQDKDLEDLANNIFAEYAEVIHGLGVDGWNQLVDSVLLDYATGKCKRRCKRKLVLARIKGVALSVGGGVACTGLSGGVATGLCAIAAGVVAGSEMAEAQIAFNECVEACDKKDDEEDEEGNAAYFRELSHRVR